MTYDALHNLKVQDYEHPGEKQALAVLRSLPAVDILLGNIIDMSSQFQVQSEYIGNYFRITEKTNPRVYKLYQTALSRLDMPEEYPLYSVLKYDYNASTLGVEKPVIIIHSSNIAEFSDAALISTIGHELGHIKSGHILYQTLANLLNSSLQSMGKLAEGASNAIHYALMEWERNSEFS